MERIKLDGRLGFSLEVTPEELDVLTGSDRAAAQELLVQLVQSEHCRIVGDTYFPPEWNEEVFADKNIESMEFDLPVVSLNEGLATDAVNIEQYKDEYFAFLKEQLKEKCNSDMCCEIYWDYRDEIGAQDVREAIDNYKEHGFESPEDCIVEKLLDYNRDYDSYMFGEIDREIRNCDNEHVVAYYETYGDLYEDAVAVGYNGIDVCIDEILGKSEFCVNVMFGTETEQDYDMGSIVTSFGSYRGPDFDYLAENVDYLDNALTYFIHQQGHSVKEVYDCLIDNPRGFGSAEEMNFAKSIVDDIVNNSSEAMSELCALVKLNGKELFELFWATEHNMEYLSFGKDTDIGIFNEWAGTGGLLEFKLDKPFVVPAGMVREIQIEGAKNSGYTVDQVYGLVGSCWKETLEFTGEAPKLYEEDLEATVKAARAFENPFELQETGREYDFIATVQNNTDSVLRFTFDENLGIEDFDVAPNDWVGLMADDNGRETYRAIKTEDYKLDIVELKPQLDDVITSCEKMSKKGIEQVCKESVADKER